MAPSPLHSILWDPDGHCPPRASPVLACRTHRLSLPHTGPHPEILNNVGHQRPPRPSQQDQSSQPCVPGECPGPGECVGGSCRKTPWKTANVTNSWAHVRQARGSCTGGLAHNLQPHWMLRPGARAEPARSPTPESRVLLRGRIGRGQEPGS